MKKIFIGREKRTGLPFYFTGHTNVMTLHTWTTIKFKVKYIY